MICSFFLFRKIAGTAVRLLKVMDFFVLVGPFDRGSLLDHRSFCVTNADIFIVVEQPYNDIIEQTIRNGLGYGIWYMVYNRRTTTLGDKTNSRVPLK